MDSNQPNLLEDMVYEKYDKTTPSISTKNGNTPAEVTNEPGLASIASEQIAAQTTAQTNAQTMAVVLAEELIREKIWQDPKKRARFSDRVKINQAMRLIMEVFIQENAKEHEFLSFFHIPLETYLDFIHSRRENALFEISFGMDETLNEWEIDPERFEVAKNTLSHLRLLVDEPDKLWQKKIALLVYTLEKQWGKSSEQPPELPLENP